MRTVLPAAAAVYLALCGFSAAEAAVILIDPFSAAQATVQVVGAPAGPRTASGALDTGTVIGGEREMRVERTSLAPNAGQTSVDVSLAVSDVATFSSGLGTRGFAVFTYDGDDSLSTFNATGLGGVDFSVTGQFRVRAISDLGGSGVIDVFTNSGNASRATFTIVPDETGSFLDYVIPFSSFSTLLGGGANFSSVGAIQFTVDGTTRSATDIGVDFVLAESGVPEPAALVLLGSGLVALALVRRKP